MIINFGFMQHSTEKEKFYKRKNLSKSKEVIISGKKESS